MTLRPGARRGRAGTRDAGLGDAAGGRQVAGALRDRAPGLPAARRPSPRGRSGRGGWARQPVAAVPPRKPTDAEPPGAAAGGPTAPAAAHKGGVFSYSTDEENGAQRVSRLPCAERQTAKRRLRPSPSLLTEGRDRQASVHEARCCGHGGADPGRRLAGPPQAEPRRSPARSGCARHGIIARAD
ncbi:translation initiation factor IF-2-like isoform X3 [Ailuropoda melanoleuca]|uniref:translation initiation factor IF-2-like isoform X3 n=1 Tax=Ailuropoda melanoleuca TaxID=9646 RepID=UPI0014945A3D|nr:translation initiation factor IF-2-like isoform X3 [Ailuropoda melanoleuca]